MSWTLRSSKTSMARAGPCEPIRAMPARRAPNACMPSLVRHAVRQRGPQQRVVTASVACKGPCTWRREASCGSARAATRDALTSKAGISCRTLKITAGVPEVLQSCSCSVQGLKVQGRLCTVSASSSVRCFVRHARASGYVAVCAQPLESVYGFCLPPPTSCKQELQPY